MIATLLGGPEVQKPRRPTDFSGEPTHHFGFSPRIVMRWFPNLPVLAEPQRNDLIAYRSRGGCQFARRSGKFALPRRQTEVAS